MRKKYLECVYQLVVIANWKIKGQGTNNKIVLFNNNKLFNIEQEKWMPSKESKLTLTDNLTYRKRGNLSLFDLEVLEKCDFKQSKNK